MGKSMSRIKLYYSSKVFDGFITIIYQPINMSTTIIRFNKVWMRFYRFAIMLDSRTSEVFAINRRDSCNGIKARKLAPAVFAVCFVVNLLVFNIALKVVVDGLRVDTMILSQIR